MIDRYSRPEMSRIWSEQNRFEKWLEVEILAATLSQKPATAENRETSGERLWHAIR